MKKSLSILSVLLSCLTLQAQEIDKYAPLDTLLSQFYLLLEPEPMEAKIAEMDSLIESCGDSLARQHIALGIFDHYSDSRLMGEEEVAIHIYDRWFADDIVPMKGDFDKLNAQIFADFNRQTLLGMQAPEITLKKACGGKATMPRKGRSAIIYFHDTSCAKCKLTGKLLPQVLDSVDFKCNLYLVYCGENAKAWKEYRRNFKIDNRNIKVIHLWDPESDSQYQRIYGVMSTPRMYMVEPGGTIIGRRLELDALKELLPYASAIQEVYREYR